MMKIGRRLNAGSFLRSSEREHLENNAGSCTQGVLMLTQTQYYMLFFLGSCC